MIWVQQPHLAVLWKVQCLLASAGNAHYSLQVVDAAASGAIKNIQKFRHNQFVHPTQFASLGSTVYFLFEFIPLSVSEVAGHLLMNDLRLASVLGQVRGISQTNVDANQQ